MLCHTAHRDCMGHTQGIILDKQQNVALEKSGMFQSYTRGSRLPYEPHITWILVKWCIWSLFWNWKMPLTKRQTYSPVVFLFGKGSTELGSTKLRHHVGLYVWRPKSTWLPLGCLSVHQSLFYLFDCGLFSVNQGKGHMQIFVCVCMCERARCMQMQMYL